MNTRSIDPTTHDPLYTCDTCSTPVVPNDKGTYSKDNRYFCSIACLYIFYEGEPVTQGEEYQV